MDLFCFLSKNLKRSLDGSFEYKSNIKVLKKTYSNITSSIYYQKEYTKEVLFIKGENSDYIDSENLKITSKLFPKYKLTEIKNADIGFITKIQMIFFQYV